MIFLIYKNKINTRQPISLIKNQNLNNNNILNKWKNYKILNFSTSKRKTISKILNQKCLIKENNFKTYRKMLKNKNKQINN